MRRNNGTPRHTKPAAACPFQDLVQRGPLDKYLHKHCSHCRLSRQIIPVGAFDSSLFNYNKESRPSSTGQLLKTQRINDQISTKQGNHIQN
jgi:hypothetical protein